MTVPLSKACTWTAVACIMGEREALRTAYHPTLTAALHGARYNHFPLMRPGKGSVSVTEPHHTHVCWCLVLCHVGACSQLGLCQVKCRWSQQQDTPRASSLQPKGFQVTPPPVTGALQLLFVFIFHSLPPAPQLRRQKCKRTLTLHP